MSEKPSEPEPKEYDWNYQNLSFLLGLAHCKEHLEDFALEVNKCKDTLTKGELEALREQYLQQEAKIRYTK